MSEIPVPAVVCEGLFVIRKPIFDRDQEVCGHELDAGASAADMVATATAITECMAQDGVDMTLVEAEESKRIIVTLSPTLLLEKAFFKMPRKRTLFVLNQDVQDDQETMERVQVFRDLGFSIGVTVGGKTPVSKSLLDIAEMVRVRLDNLEPKEIMCLVREIKPLGKPMLASGVDEWETFEGTRALGFTRFQGTFFSTPKIQPGKKLSENSLNRVMIMRELMRPGCDLNELANIIAQDTVLSYRLLKFINSASFALVQKVNSIQQAVSLLGLDPLKQWAFFMVMAEMDKSSKGEELSYTGLQRARFMEQCAVRSNTAPVAPEAMFMTGLFSRLDAMLGLPMHEIIKGMPIDEQIGAALCGQQNGVRAWLDMTDAVDAGNWPRAQALLSDVGVDPKIAAVEYMRASAWSGKHFIDHKGL